MSISASEAETKEQRRESADSTISARNIGYFLALDIAAMSVLISYRMAIADWSIQSISWLTVVVSAAVLAATSAVSSKRLGSISSLYAAIFLVFHFGLTYGLVMGRPVTESDPFATEWFYQWSTKYAYVLSMIGAVALLAGVHVTILIRDIVLGRDTIDRIGARIPSRNGDEGLGSLLSLFGGVMTVGAVAAWLLAVLTSGGLAVLLGSYSSYRDVTDPLGLSTNFFIIGLGLSFMAAGRPAATRRIGVAAYLCFAVIGLPLGLRGEVMFPAVAAMAILVKRGKFRVRPVVGLVLVVTALAAISLFGSIRSGGVRGLGESSVTASPTVALGELGHEVRPISDVVLWDEQGVPQLGGGSFVAPFDRAIHRVLFLPQQPADTDPRLLNEVVKARSDGGGGIGFSPVAEGFTNFGVTGVVGFMLIIGLVLGGLDHAPCRPRWLAITGVLLVPMLIEVRNAFSFVPGQIGLGLAALGLIALLPRSRARTARQDG